MHLTPFSRSSFFAISIAVSYVLFFFKIEILGRSLNFKEVIYIVSD